MQYETRLLKIIIIRALVMLLRLSFSREELNIRSNIDGKIIFRIVMYV